MEQEQGAPTSKLKNKEMKQDEREAKMSNSVPLRYKSQVNSDYSSLDDVHLAFLALFQVDVVDAFVCEARCKLYLKINTSYFNVFKGGGHLHYHA